MLKTSTGIDLEAMVKKSVDKARAAAEGGGESAQAPSTVRKSVGSGPSASA